MLLVTDHQNQPPVVNDFVSAAEKQCVQRSVIIEAQWIYSL